MNNSIVLNVVDPNALVTGTDTYSELDPSMRQAIFCYRSMMTWSGGVWRGNNPFDFSFPVLLYQIILVFVATRVVHSFLRRLSQPQVISQIIVIYAFFSSSPIFFVITRRPYLAATG